MGPPPERPGGPEETAMISVRRGAWSRFVRVARPYFTSDARRPALLLLAALVGLLLALSGLNVVNSYVGRDFMTAIADRRPHQVATYALAYLAVFAASTAAGALQRYAELVLGLRWRAWLTEYFIGRWLARHAYYWLDVRSGVDNPDQRISEDVKTFTTTTLSFFIMALNSVITIVAFCGVLWSITPWLLGAAVLYPLLGTALSVLVGRRLVWLNNLQLKKEADFRFALVHVRQHAEPIALVGAENKERGLLRDRLTRLVENYRQVIRVLRNLKFFTGGYNYLTQLIPILIVAPLYLRGEVEFGVVTQSAMAFSQVFNAFSLIVEQFQDLSTFAAVIGRLGSLQEAITDSAEKARRGIQVVEQDARLAYEHVTLRCPGDNRTLVRDLSLEVPRGRRVLVTAPHGAGKSALFRATAGLWEKGNGRIIRPAGRQILFLPQWPYMAPGTLRDQFLEVVPEAELTDQRLRDVLRDVGLGSLPDRVGGLGARHDWAGVLSPGEQQLVAVARLLLARPAYALLDRAGSALDESHRARLYQLLARTPITYVSIGDHEPALEEHHDRVLELRPDGSWAVEPLAAAAGRG
jgi:putative ATP-binding cassette transporter